MFASQVYILTEFNLTVYVHTVNSHAGLDQCLSVRWMAKKQKQKKKNP